MVARGRSGWCYLGVAGLLLILCPLNATAQSGNEAVVVRLARAREPIVAPVTAREVTLSPNEVGLAVWSEKEGGDRRAIFRGTWKQPASGAAPDEVAPRTLADVSRGGATAAVGGPVQWTTQLDCLLLPSVVKSIQGRAVSGFLTPVDGSVVLSSRPTFRRVPSQQTSPATAVLMSGAVKGRIEFSAGEAAVEYANVSGLPDGWKQGLPPGNYVLRFEQPAGAAVRFTVADESVRRGARKWLDEWDEVVGGRSDPRYTVAAVEFLLAQQPQPYFGDALDLLDALPPEQSTPHLRWRRESIVGSLQSRNVPSPYLSGEDEATGVAGVDDARMLIAQGRWNDALTRLEAAADAADARGRALADLYRGVIHAEWGVGQEQAAEFFFTRAIAALQSAAPADRFRAYNNYANFLLNRTQDRTLDPAFSVATGVRSLFVTALLSWEDARRNYETARRIADDLGPDARGAVNLNFARLYAMLADVLAILDVSAEPTPELVAAEATLSQLAQQHVARALSEQAGSDPLLLAVAETIRAHLAFRAGDSDLSRTAATGALDRFVQAGALSGIESVERLLGILDLRRESSNPQAAAQARKSALKHFLASHLLSELLRGQVPAERIGRTRAGFFARRSFVHQRIVELLLAEGRDTEALKYAELAKARALQDVLATRDGTSVLQGDVPSRIEELLAGWPGDVMALEYYLTMDRAYAFLIDSSGKVKAYPLRDEASEPLASRDLIRRIHLTLRAEMDQHAEKVRQRVLESRGFDHTWQDRLAGLRRELLPDDVVQRLDKVSTLVIVPHHILHYFPFAALVIERDAASRGNLEMVKPRFLVEAPCNVCYAPSLATWWMLRSQTHRPIERIAAAGIEALPGAPPLPGVAEEIGALRRVFGSRVQTVLWEQDADKAGTLRLLHEPGLVLVGTHGRNWPEQPLASELLLYPQGRDHGRLTAGELYFSDVRSDLVVLSACDTGLADQSPLPGDDLFGLQRALLQSGARTVVTGQWDIYDGTGPRLIGDFFGQLSRGVPAPEALAAAQRRFLAELRASPDPEPWLHPYFWAVYSVAGDDRTSLSGTP